MSPAQPSLRTSALGRWEPRAEKVTRLSQSPLRRRPVVYGAEPMHSLRLQFLLCIPILNNAERRQMHFLFYVGFSSESEAATQSLANTARVTSDSQSVALRMFK